MVKYNCKETKGFREVESEVNEMYKIVDKAQNKVIWKDPSLENALAAVEYFNEFDKQAGDYMPFRYEIIKPDCDC